jgi:hypothetical protein
MKRVRALLLAITFGSGICAYAQQTPGGVPVSEVEVQHNICTYTISSAAALTVCISAHGNLRNLISPAGSEHIAGGYGEGYHLCHSGGRYYDLGFGEEGWNEPTVLSVSSSKVALERTTTDNRFTLTQTWTRDLAKRDVTVTNVLKANVASTNVLLIRYADVNANGDGIDDAHDYSRFGYSLRDVDAVTGTDTTFTADSVWVGSFSGTCGAYLVQPRPQAATGDDWSGVIRYNGGNMAAGSKKTWKVTYRVQ